MWKSLLLVLLGFTGISSQKPCVPQTKSAGIVCVCNSTYCDEVPPLGVLQPEQVAVYTTSESGQRFARTNLNFTSGSLGQVDATITINSSITYQKIQGFGTAFSGSASVNVMSLPVGAQINLIASYFGENGNGYIFGRVPIGAADFSLSQYSYDDFPNDFSLVNFSLGDEDIKYKIPAMKIAQSLIGENLKLFGSPWSGPAWMKTMDNMNSLNNNTMKGNLLGNNDTTKWWQTYTNYFYKFFDEHAKQNVTFWGLTIQNEPTIHTSAVGMYLTAEVERDFIKYFLGPKMKSNALTKNLKIMIWDFNRGGAEDFIDTVLADPFTSSYVDGIAMHWYDDMGINSTVPENIHNKHPNFWILNTEACTGLAGGPYQGVTLGNWTRGELYAHDIMDNLNHWSTGWIDWNLALNERGGPGGKVDAPIVVANDNLTFYKQPMFYTFGHFSKFIRPDSYRIATTWGNPQGNLEGGSFITPTNQIVVVLHNRDDNKNYTVSIKDAQNPCEAIKINIEKKSIVTLIWNQHKNCNQH